MFNIKPHIHQRLLEGTNKTLCALGPKERRSDCHKRLSQTCLCMFDDLLCGHGTAVACHGDRGTGNTGGTVYAHHRAVGWTIKKLQNIFNPTFC